MKKDNSYHDYILYDVLGHIDGITSRAMFSGFGIYKDGAIVAIIADGELYFKANKDLKEKYVQQGYYPFQYLSRRSSAKEDDRNGKMAQMNYLSVKIEDLENRDEMSRRVEESYEISNKHK